MKTNKLTTLIGLLGLTSLACNAKTSIGEVPDAAGTPAWSAVAVTAAFPPRMSHLGLAFHGRIWIMGGEGQDGAERNDVWSSADGRSWTMATAAADWSVRGLAAGVVFQDKMWLIDGVRESDVWTSTDGAAWTAVAQAAPFPGRFGQCALVFNDKIWIIGGYGAAGTSINDVWSSTDGATWMQVTAAADWSPRDDFGCVVFGGKMCVIDGVHQGDVWTSTDGASWTAVTPTAPFTPTKALQSVVWKGEIWTLGGGDGAGQVVNAVFHSPDGVVWTQMADVPWRSREFFASVVLADKVWLIDGNERLGDVWKME
jgi:hypothetical protein